MADKTLGQAGFDAYGDHAGWKAYDGKPMPRWDDALRADIKEKWEVAGKAIVAMNAADRGPAAVRAILADFTDRKGLRQVWESIDDDIRDEIIETWTDLLQSALTKEAP